MPDGIVSRPRRRLLVPHQRTEPREVLVAALPFFLRGDAAPVAAAPPLLSFEGAGFLDDFLAAAGNPGKLPKLLPWRDWAEPPAGVLDAAGRARYPESLKRAQPIAIAEKEPTADGVPEGDPPWLRKLYLPLHQRFTLVAFDLVCRRLGFPPVDRARLRGAGAVIRRLRPGAALAWEDWISADGKRGAWVRLALPIEALDPAALPDAAFTNQELSLRARLGMEADAPWPALDSAKLAPLAHDAAGGAAARHTTLYGYLPLFSAAEQVADLAPASAAVLSAALQARATAAVQAARADAPELAARISPHVTSLFAETVLPPPPDGDLDDAWELVRDWPSAEPRPGLGDAERDTAFTLDRLLRAMLVAGYQALAPALAEGDALDAEGPESTATWLGRAREAMDGWVVAGGLEAERFGSGWGAQNFRTNRVAWRLLLNARLGQLVAAVAAGAPMPRATATQPAGVDAQDRLLLILCALLRLRALRIALAVALRRQCFGPTAETQSLVAQVQGVPAGTPGAVGQEIAAALGLEAWRGTPQEPPWPPLDTTVPADPGRSEAAYRAHLAGFALEGIFATFEDALAPAGTAFAAEQDVRLAAADAALRARIGQLAGIPPGNVALRAQGIELREQPARGLFATPGPTPSAAAIETLTAPLVAHYAAQANAIAVARDEARVPRLRYEHDALYAVWCFARVAGRDACEKQQIVWTQASEPFSIAEPSDVLGAQPATVTLPDIPRLIRDIPRIAKARARPFAAFAAPPNSSYITGEEPADTQRAWGIGWVCSFGIPVLTICAYILFSIIFSILIIIPGFAWMLFLKFCIPIPKRSS